MVTPADSSADSNRSRLDCLPKELGTQEGGGRQQHPPASPPRLKSQSSGQPEKKILLYYSKAIRAVFQKTVCSLSMRVRERENRDRWSQIKPSP